MRGEKGKERKRVYTPFIFRNICCLPVCRDIFDFGVTKLQKMLTGTTNPNLDDFGWSTFVFGKRNSHSTADFKINI
ncbi:hypothetical protein L3Y34_002860 [Caenorhabditis briggsae]|uniref:Uncharacterized protein n=1 Tax=Caenorhabditis briggsae TaxID=6238 RepID=A0AAE9A7Y7_CAEBR|nr:hypothetical protein L3Y34_002860 [Caenorhabditis briggsae]